MLSPQEVIDTYFLDHRFMVLEIAAFLDRYDAAVESSGEPAPDRAQLDVLRRAIDTFGQPAPPEGRAARLLELFATV